MRTFYNMKTEQSRSLPVACNLSALDPEQSKRHDALLNELFASFQETHELRNGYELSLPGDGKWYLELAEWVTLERLCCPFLTFEQGFDTDGSIWLRLTGDSNVKQFLKTYVNHAVHD